MTNGSLLATYTDTWILENLCSHLRFKLFVLAIRIKLGIVLVICRLRRAGESWSCDLCCTARRKVSLDFFDGGLPRTLGSLAPTSLEVAL